MLGLLDALLGPLARLLVARGVLFPDFAERMKAHYVAAAEGLGEGKATDSRLSVMTGLQRRDIARLRGAAPREGRTNHLARLVALWRSEPGYADADGPKPLPRNGPAPSFEALAREVRRDVHPRTMLDTLLATGTVALDPAAREVRLLASSYQPLAGSDDQIGYLAHNLGDHVLAATENVLGRDPPHFERALHYTGLTADQVSAIEADYRTAQMALFERLALRAAEMKRASGGAGGERFRAGGYFYRTAWREEKP